MSDKVCILDCLKDIHKLNSREDKLNERLLFRPINYCYSNYQLL